MKERLWASGLVDVGSARGSPVEDRPRRRWGNGAQVDCQLKPPLADAGQVSWGRSGERLPPRTEVGLARAQDAAGQVARLRSALPYAKSPLWATASGSHIQYGTAPHQRVGSPLPQPVDPGGAAGTWPLARGLPSRDTEVVGTCLQGVARTVPRQGCWGSAWVPGLRSESGWGF